MNISKLKRGLCLYGDALFILQIDFRIIPD